VEVLALIENVGFGDSMSGGCTVIASSPFVISGFATSGVVVPNFALNSMITLSGICGLVSCSRSHCSRITFSISFAVIRSDRGSASSIKINLYTLLYEIEAILWDSARFVHAK